MAPSPPPALAVAPAPAPWVHGATRITYPTQAYPSEPSYTNTAIATYSSRPTSTYKVPGAYPDPPLPSSSYIFNTTETKYEYKPTYRPPQSPRPLENPEVRAAIAHEQNLRKLSEQSHQETLKRQLLEIEITKASAQKERVRQEENARDRMQRLYMLSQQQQQQQMMFMAAEEAHHKYHSSHHHHGRSRSTHSTRSRSRVRSRSRSREIEYDEHRRSIHTCGRCHHKGHYSKECHHNHHVTHHRSNSTLLLEGGPRSSAPALLGPGSSRGRRSRRGSTVGSDDDYAVESEEDWWSDEYEGRTVPSDSGVLVMYAPGGGPATRRSSIRHVVGA